MEGLLAIFLLFGGGRLVYMVVENWNNTRLELARLRIEQAGVRADGGDLVTLREEVSRLRHELQDLRDTSTQYDLSFDTALQRLERRMERVEQGQQQATIRN